MVCGVSFGNKTVANVEQFKFNDVSYSSNELKEKSCFSIETHPERKKNICTSRSFGANVKTFQLIQESITTYAVRCAEKLRSEKSCARYVSVILNTNPFNTSGEHYNGYKSLALNTPTNDTGEIVHTAHNLLKSIYKKGLTYKKAGVIVGDIIPENQVQLNLFDIDSNHHKKKKDAVHNVKQYSFLYRRVLALPQLKSL